MRNKEDCRIFGVVGSKNSGKSYFAKQVFQHLKNSGVKTLGFCPLGNPLPVHSQADSIDHLLEMAQHPANMDSRILIEECGHVNCIGTGKQANDYQYFGTMATHHRHDVWFVMQRGTQLEKTIRDQMDHLFLFQVDWKDSEDWALAFNNKGLKDAYRLKKRFYFEAIKGEANPVKPLTI